MQRSEESAMPHPSWKPDSQKLDVHHLEVVMTCWNLSQDQPGNSALKVGTHCDSVFLMLLVESKFMAIYKVGTKHDSVFLMLPMASKFMAVGRTFPNVKM